MTRCSHLRRLNSSFFPELLDEVRQAEATLAKDPSKGLGDLSGWALDVKPYGRYFAEYWLFNDLGPRPDHVVETFDATAKGLPRSPARINVCGKSFQARQGRPWYPFLTLIILAAGMLYAVGYKVREKLKLGKNR